MTKSYRQLLHQAPKCKLILQYGVGLEGVDIEAATTLGIYVANIPSDHTPNALSCAEMAIFLMLALARDIHSMNTSVATRQLGTPCGKTLYGAHALIIGFGGLARQLIPRLAALGMTMSCVRGNAGHWHTGHGGSHGDVARLLAGRGGVEDLPVMLPDADYVVVTCSQVRCCPVGEVDCKWVVRVCA